ncbi:MAG: methylmalonyl-CoA epimerase [Anaerolineae bacterium]|nr:methylmalonyl-CoA epimerase [Anaerolineae bacterium]
MPHRVNHIAIAVPDLAGALAFWRDALGLPLERRETNPEEGVEIGFLALGELRLELLQPLEPQNSIGRFLEKRGPGLHHMCVEVEDILASLAHLRGQGVELINPTPRTRPDGVRYAFIHPRSTGGVLLELYELP